MIDDREPGSVPMQKQEGRPGSQSVMRPTPRTDNPQQTGSGKLFGKVAIITGGDSGIGRAVAIAFAKEGADIVISYLSEDEDADKTVRMVEKYGRRAVAVRGDIGLEKHCHDIVAETIASFGSIDIIVNNAGEQSPQKSLLDISEAQLLRTFRTNIFSMFFLTKAGLPHLKSGSSIIMTSSVTAFHGSSELLDYSATKGAVTSFARSLSLSLAQMGIRVNSVAPGPIWTPLIPSTFSKNKIKKFGKDVPMGRPGQPEEVAPAYVFLASDEASYITGQTVHVNGGEIING